MTFRDATKPISARCVPARFGERCCAPGCGDKIKPGSPEQTMYEVTWSDGDVTYLEDDSCALWFVNGHPDIGCGRGPVPGLLDDPIDLSALAARAWR